MFPLRDHSSASNRLHHSIGLCVLSLGLSATTGMALAPSAESPGALTAGFSPASEASRWRLLATARAPELPALVSPVGISPVLEARPITVALIDSGLDLRQPALAAHLWRHPREQADGRDNDGNGLVDDLHGWDFVQANGKPQDQLGHGTEMAGLILRGAPQARLMVLRVLNERRHSDGRTVAQAIDYARQQGAEVINLSLISERPSPEVAAAIRRALEAGLQVVAATGNSGRQSPLFPARLPGVVAVGATSGTGERKSWSNGGAGKPGEVLGIPTDDLATTRLGGGWTRVDGTSAAAALISGHLAGLRSRSSHPIGIPELLQVPSVSLLR